MDLLASEMFIVICVFSYLEVHVCIFMLKHILAYARTHVHIYIINMFVPTTENRYIY